MKSANVRRVTVIGLIAAISLIVAACGSSSKSTASTVKAVVLPTSWELPGANAQNTRDVGGPINASNVSTLGVAWTVPDHRRSGIRRATRRRRSCPAA